MLGKLLQDFLIIWATIDPIGTMALFAGLTGRLTPAARRKTAYKAIAYSAAVLLGAIVIGQVILSAMGISLLSFQLAGGIILFLFGLQMIFSSGSEDEKMEPQHDMAVFPLAIPATASPGAILAVILLTDNQVYPVSEQ
ncbi:MAG TPA: MarC family protein, partial [Thiolinea sp.]|nr:MarC family protein [Thiolinea sp.]